MPRFFPTALFLIVLVVCFKSVENIKCYVCRSDATKGCTGKLDESLVKECPKRPQALGQYCRKIEQQLYFMHQETTTTIRECAYEKNRKQCYKSDWINAAFQEICECDQDLCNRSARGVAAGIFTTITMISLPLYTYIFFR